MSDYEDEDYPDDYDEPEYEIPRPPAMGVPRPPAMPVAAAMGLPEPVQRLARYQSDEEAFMEKSLIPQGGQLLLARFEQFRTTDIDVHELLQENLFGNSREHVYELFRRTDVTHFENFTDSPPPIMEGSVQDLDKHPIRFASFYISIKNLESSATTPIISVELVPTIPIPGFYIMNLLNMEGGELTPYMTPRTGIFENLALKIIRELKVIGYKLNGSDNPDEKPCNLLISFDIYYNRSKASAGIWHRDSTHYIGSHPIYASLEFFTGDGIYFLGPDALIHSAAGEPPEVYLDRYADYKVKAMLDSRRAYPGTGIPKSFRLLCRNRTTILFNNYELIHATPITEPIEPKEEGAPYINVLGHDERRLETVAPQHPIVQNTRTLKRSFLRTHISGISSSTGVSYTPPENSIKLNTFFVLGLIQAIPGIDYHATAVTEEDLYGGTTIENIQPEVNSLNKLNNSNIKQVNPLLETKIQNNLTNKTPSSETELLEFKIVGNPLKPVVELNFDVPFQEVTGENNIQKNELELVSFISSISNKKGGKNRRYKKRYNNKTKKTIKTKKVRKLKRSAKTKKVKRVKKLHKYSKKNYKY